MTTHRLNRRQALAFVGASASLAAFGASAKADRPHAQRALVTGCSTGFGRLTALALAEAGFEVFAGIRFTQDENAQAVQHLDTEASARNLRLGVIDIDVREQDSVEAAVSLVQASSGPVDVLVNNAGILIPGSVELHSEAAVRQQFETNLFGYHRVAQAVLPSMRERGQGLIVQVSSGLGRIVIPTQGWYVATKFALEGMSEALAYELAPFGVDVSIVQPTAYPTQFLANGRQYFETMLNHVHAERSAAYAQQIEMTRFGLQDEAGPDPSAVSQAIRDIALMAPGTRPLRRVVSPEPDGLRQINAGLSQAQDAVLASTPFAAWRAAVTEDGGASTDE